MPQAKLTQVFVRDLKKDRPARPVDYSDKDLTGFVARLRPSGSVTYLLKYRDITGKGRNYTIGRDGDGLDATKARDIAEDLKHQIKRGADPQRERKKTAEAARTVEARTLDAYYEERYKPHYLDRRNRKGKARSERGKAESKRIIEKNFGHLFALPMTDITADVIDQWEDSKKHLDTETIKRYRAELESLFKTAELEKPESGWKWIDDNPLAGLTPIAAKSHEASNPRYLSPAETKRLLAALRDRDAELRQKATSGNQWRKERGKELLPDPPEHYADHLEPMVLISLKTGLRRNELFSLEWADVEADFRAITVRASIAKSKKSRIIPLSKTATDTLEKWRDQTPSNQLVFSNNGEKFTTLKTSWRTLMKRAKIDNFRWHDMRHDFASQLVIRNVSIQKVSVLLGHGDIKTTMRYAHLSNESLVAAVAELD